MLTSKRRRTRQAGNSIFASREYAPSVLFDFRESIAPPNAGYYQRALNGQWSVGANPALLGGSAGVGISTSGAGVLGRKFTVLNSDAAADVAASSPFWMAAAFTHYPFFNEGSGVNVLCGLQGFGNISAYINSSNVLTVECKSTSLTGPTLVAGRTYHILWGRNIAGACWLWVNGALYTSGASATAGLTSTAELRLHVSGDFGSTFRAYRGSIALFAMGHSDPHAFGGKLSANLWQLFAARSIPFPESVGGGPPPTFIPAWAHRQTRTIGAGVI